MGVGVGSIRGDCLKGKATHSMLHVFTLLWPLEAWILSWTQAESIQRREELLQEMESVSQLTARQSKLKEEERIKRAEELREQVIHL